MIVNIGIGVAPVKIAFSSSRRAASIEYKILQNTKLSMKLRHCTLREIKTEVFITSDVLSFVSVRCADRKKHSNRDFLTKSIKNTLRKCVDIANEYLHAYNTGVKKHVFCSLRQCKCAGYTMFLITFVLSN